MTHQSELRRLAISTMHDNIRALTFDLDDTLWDNRPVLRAAEQSL